MTCSSSLLPELVDSAGCYPLVRSSRYKEFTVAEAQTLASRQPDLKATTPDQRILFTAPLTPFPALSLRGEVESSVDALQYLSALVGL